VTIKMNSRVGVGQGERVGLHVHDRDGIIRKSGDGQPRRKSVPCLLLFVPRQNQGLAGHDTNQFIGYQYSQPSRLNLSGYVVLLRGSIL
jgi:hypothetical protein